MSVRIDMPVIVNTFSSKTSRSVTVDLVTSMYLNGFVNVSSSARRVELEVHCDDDR